MSDYSKLCIHTITTKPWDIWTAIEKYQAAGVGGITVWRQWLDGQDIEQVGQAIRAAGIEIVSLCRGGFFPASEQSDLDAAIADNELAIREAAALGAPMIVLVCGAVPGQSLGTSREQIIAGIRAVLPLAEQHGIKLAIEPLHPLYADDRSAINTMETANDVCDEINHPLVGIAADVYHIWWDPNLERELARTAAADRLFAFHICDWRTPTTDLLNDRGLMGEGCIDLSGIRQMVESHGFDGFHEVEVFSDRWWSKDQDEYLAAIQEAWRAYW